MKNRRLRGNMINEYEKYLMEGRREHRAKFLVMLSENTRGNEHKQKYWKFHLNTL